MKVVLFYNRNLPVGRIKTYGSVMALVENENIIIKNKKQDHRAIYHKLSKNDAYKDDSYYISRQDVVRKKQL